MKQQGVRKKRRKEKAPKGGTCIQVPYMSRKYLYCTCKRRSGVSSRTSSPVVLASYLLLLLLPANEDAQRILKLKVRACVFKHYGRK